MIALASHLSAVAAPYSVLLVDVWGVIHNGVSAFPAAAEALVAVRARGAKVILISNAPRLSPEIPPQLRRLGVPDTAYDSVATSGDAARHLIETWSGGRHLKLHHIGPERDLSLFAGLNVECVPLADAAYIVCTGPFDDETETPDDYNDRLLEIKKRNVPFLCANPDLVVQRGDRLIYCAGALAQRLEELGGSAIYCGKPHTPIYELAFERAAVLIGRVPTKGEVVAIGDALRTDILGAQRYGIASILIAGGIHGAEFSGTNGLDLSLVEAKCRELGARPIAVMEKLTP